jgi:hypothetical protein
MDNQSRDELWREPVLLTKHGEIPGSDILYA